MAHYKRRKPRRQVKCTICTPYRLLGNRLERRPIADRRVLQEPLSGCG